MGQNKAVRKLKYWIAEITGNKDLLKKKRIRAKRDKVTTRPNEILLEKTWFGEYVDRCVRSQLRIMLNSVEMDAISLVFDSFASHMPHERLTRVEFIQLLLNGGGANEERDFEISVDFLKELEKIFEHAKTFYRKEFIIPGKQHPYLAERHKSTFQFKVRQAVIEEVNKQVLKIRGIPPPDILDVEERLEEELTDEERKNREEEWYERETISLHELLLSVSFWKQQSRLQGELQKKDDVSFFFRLFDGSGHSRWTEGEFALAMRVLLEGVYLSDYEDRVALPKDCDPSEREKEEAKEARFKTLEDIEREEAELGEMHKRKNLIERYLNVVYDEIDRAKMGIIDIEDVQEFLDETGAAPTEFGKNDKGESNLELAFQAVGAKEEPKLSRDQFYAFIENSHLMSFNLGDELELKLFELSRVIAREEFDIESTRYISLLSFRQYLRNSPDKRLASMVVRVARCVRAKCSSIHPKARQAVLDVLRFQTNKPKFRILRKELTISEAPVSSQKKTKALISKSLVALRKSFTGKSPLETLRIAPAPFDVSEDEESIVKELVTEMGLPDEGKNDLHSPETTQIGASDPVSAKNPAGSALAKDSRHENAAT